MKPKSKMEYIYFFSLKTYVRDWEGETLLGEDDEGLLENATLAVSFTGNEEEETPAFAGDSSQRK